MSHILVTGGAGYIGSHTVVELINNGYNVVVVDNLSNSSYDSIARIEYIVGKTVPFFNVDIRNSEKLSEVFDKYDISGVIHFAALKAVGESTKIPLSYYDNNIIGTITLLEVMKKKNVKTIVFSSSATVYGDVTRFGDNRYIPIPENCPMDPTNPYGQTKFMIESITRDIHSADPSWKVAILRYFNPIGAHSSGLIGEDPLGIPNNLLPYLAQVASGRREKLNIFGNDYNSHDGTPIRDYIHVVDLAKGHIAALEYLNNLQTEGLYREWNLGTGKGSTVFEVYNAFCKAVGRQLPYEVVGRRAGDVLDLTANPTRANAELKWKTELTVDDACKDLWKWTQMNPFGFRDEHYSWKTFDGYTNRLHTVSRGELEVAFANYGALIQDIRICGKSIVTKFDNAENYYDETNPLFGSTVGRYANRIRDGRFEIDNQLFDVTKNENGNCLHSGQNGMNKQFWLGPVVESTNDFTRVSFLASEKEGNDGFPGNLSTIVKYTVRDDSLEIEYQSITDKATVVNLTNHSYFNLCQEENINSTELQLFTDNSMELIKGIPTGQIVKNDKVSLGKSFPLTEVFDDCFVVDEECALDTRKQPLKKIVEANHPNSQISLVISTTEPAFQLYTGDHTNTTGFCARSGFAVEPSRYVDAISNEKWKKQVILRPEEVYGSKLKYEFIRK